MQPSQELTDLSKNLATQNGPVTALGSKGRGGAVGLGSLGVNGLAGGDGYIIVTEYY